MKRFFTIALVLSIFVTILSACGKSTANPETSSTNSVQASTQPTVEKDEPVTISILQAAVPATDKKDFNIDLLPQLVKDKFSNITLNSEVLPGDQFVTTLKARLASGEGPDLYNWWPKNQALEMIDPGFAKDITGLSILSKFSDSSVAAYSKNSVNYGIPSGVNILGVYYNKDMFTKAGVTTVPQDWPSFLDACKKLKAANFQPIVEGNKDGVAVFGLFQMAAGIVYPADIDFDSKLSAGTQKFAGSSWADVLTKYASLSEAGYIQKNSLGVGNAQAQQLFIDGKAAMTFDGNWAGDGVMKKGAVDFERGFFPLPANDAGKPVNLCAAASTGTFINANTKVYDSIVKVLEYWYDGSSPLFKAWVDYNVGQIPAYKGLEFSGNAIFSDFYKLYQTNNSYYFCDQAWPAGLGSEVVSKYQTVIGGKMSVSDAIKGIDVKLAELLAQKK